MKQPVNFAKQNLCGTFDRLRQVHRKALIPFIMGGDPDLDTTERLILALEQAGADLIEIGIPFSDPLADGPTIQQASSRALNRGATPAAVLKAVASASRKVSVPLVLLSYWNPVAQYGNGARSSATDASAFLRDAARGAAGLIVPDLPPEEASALRHAARQTGMSTIFLAAPTSPPNRLRDIARISDGFIYYVSLTGTTGARKHLPSEWLHGVRQLKLITTKPVCVGFGISTPAQAASVARVADGVIIGSALIRALDPASSNRSAIITRAERFLRRLREAV